MDVFLTSEARADFKAIKILRPPSGTWGLLLGHERGFRFFVERAFPAGRLAPLSSELWEELNSVWGGRVIGLFAYRASASFKKRLLDPGFYGKLYLEVGISGKAMRFKAHAVEHRRGFVFSALPLEESPMEGGHD